MNRRILKKLCKKAKPLLIAKGINPDGFFLTDELEPAWTSNRMPRKDLDRWPPDGRANPHGYFMPLKGTWGWGYVSGYEEPEWEDEPAWEALVDMYAMAHTNWHSEGFDYFGSRPLPAAVFSWAKSRKQAA